MEGTGKGEKKHLKWLKFLFGTRIHALYNIISMIFTCHFFTAIQWFHSSFCCLPLGNWVRVCRSAEHLQKYLTSAKAVLQIKGGMAFSPHASSKAGQQGQSKISWYFKCVCLPQPSPWWRRDNKIPPLVLLCKHKQWLTGCCETTGWSRFIRSTPWK